MPRLTAPKRFSRNLLVVPLAVAVFVLLGAAWFFRARTETATNGAALMDYLTQEPAPGIGLLAALPPSTPSSVEVTADSVLASEAAAVPPQSVTVSAAVNETVISVPILIYHNIDEHKPGDTPSQRTFTVTPENLEKQLLRIKELGYQTVTPSEVRSRLVDGTPLPEKPLIIAFDDGWRTQYVNAFPLLQKMKMRAVFFVFTNPLGKDKRFFTWEDLKKLVAAGMEIGSHGVTHPYMTKTADKSLVWELVASREAIVAKTGQVATALAYPFGLTDDRVTAAATAAGYRFGRGLWHDKNIKTGGIMRVGGYIVTDDFGAFRKIVE